MALKYKQGQIHQTNEQDPCTENCKVLLRKTNVNKWFVYGYKVNCVLPKFVC